LNNLRVFEVGIFIKFDTIIFLGYEGRGKNTNCDPNLVWLSQGASVTFYGFGYQWILKPRVWTLILILKLKKSLTHQSETSIPLPLPIPL
jgi:hypothetical protein